MKHRDPWGRGERERGEGQRGEGQRGTQNPDTWNSEPQWLRTEREQRAGPTEERPPERGGQERYDNAYRSSERSREPYNAPRDERDVRSRAGSWEDHSRGYEATGWDDPLDLGGGQRYQPFHVGTGMGLGTGSPGYGYGYGSRGGWDLGTHERDIGRSFRGMGPEDYTRPDERIRDDIHERLTQSHDIDARKILVEVSQGTVTLTGTVIERRMRYLAEDLVEGVTGVTNINNQLQVRNGSKSPGAAPGTPDDQPH